jgi:hypothetical protein
MPGRGKPFERGNKVAPGGKRKGAGRPPDTLRHLCRKLIHEKRGVHKVAEIMAGEHFVAKKITLKSGAEIDVKELPKPDTMIAAFHELADRGYGKSIQEVNVTGGLSVNVTAMAKLAKEMRAARGLRP